MNQLVKKVEAGDYRGLFIQDLNWNAPDHRPLHVSVDGRSWTVENVASYSGLRVWVCPGRPDAATQVAIDRQVAATTTDRLVIFHSPEEQVWRWPGRVVRGSRTTVRLTSHRHRTGNPDPGFAAKLEAITLPVTEELAAHQVLAKLRSAFDIEARNETKHASKLMASMYTALEGAYPPGTSRVERDHAISVTLARVLFLMFGDDTEMWRADQFRDFVLACAPDGSDTHTRLNKLFTCLNTPEDQRDGWPEEYQAFRYVNGGIFAETVTVPPVSPRFRELVLEACDRDWSAISPAIFGSMFQSVRNAEVRRQLGEHYTSEENILKTLNPLLLDELRAEYVKAKEAGTPRKELNALNRLRERLGRIRFMDPACGCGNFIIVAYRELRDLELAIMERVADLTGQPPQLLANVGLAVRLEHFYGIEIDEWPARIAQTAMFLVDRQCDLKLEDRLGLPIDRLPIREQATIVVGNAIRTDWQAVCPAGPDVVIAGNPPFLGPHTRSPEQLADLQLVWGSKDLGRLDYVTAWHRKCVDYFRNVDGGRFALVSTSSIAQGDQVARLFPMIFNAGWRIRFAHQTFVWTSEAGSAAAVHCVIVGFDRGEKTKPVLYEYPSLQAAPVPRQVDNINAYLTAGPNIIVTSRPDPLSPELNRVVLGSMAKDGGHLIVEAEDLPVFEADPVARKYLRPYYGSRELLNGEHRWVLWLDGADPEDWKKSPLVVERVNAVKAFRLSAKAGSTKDFARIPHLFTQRAAQTTTFVCIPGTSSENRPYLPCALLPADAIASHANYQVRDPDGFQFAVLSSRMFMTWQLAIGGRLESRLRFAVRTVWNNFPLPRLDRATRQQVIVAGQGVLAARAAHPDTPLSKLYSPTAFPEDLRRAHELLDEVVDEILGASRAADTAAREAVLFARYAELAGAKAT